MAITCPGCGATATGKFCSQCGTPLEADVRCGRCGNTIPEGGRFCNMCGAPAIASAEPVGSTPAPSVARQRNPNVPWYIAGAALLALIVALVGPRLGNEDPAVTPAPPVTGPAGDPSAVRLEDMTPLEASTRLFNRVLAAVEAGDTVEARTFAPMAIASYDMVEPVTLDVLYHIALLQLINGEPSVARQTADRIMAEAPNHLFALMTAAQAETLLGNTEAAADFYRRFLDSYDAEIATQRVEYEDHSAVLPAMREEAERFAGPE